MIKPGYHISIAIINAFLRIDIGVTIKSCRVLTLDGANYIKKKGKILLQRGAGTFYNFSINCLCLSCTST